MPPANPPIVDISRYLNADLFDELGLDALSPEERVRFLEEMGGIVQQRVMIRVFDELSDEQKDELEAIIQTNPDNPQKVVEYVLVALPDYEALALEEMALYKKELVERFQAMQG